MFLTYYFCGSGRLPKIKNPVIAYIVAYPKSVASVFFVKSVASVFHRNC